MKVYAVKVGRQPGIYESWPEAQAQVHGVPAVYKSFASRAEAERWIAEPLPSGAAAPARPRPKNRALPRPPSAPPTLPLEPSAYDREFWAHSVYSAQSGRVAWALLSNRDPPLAQLYGGPPPEHPERGVLCALLRLLTRANLDPLLRDKRLLVHLCHPNWPIYQALTSWIFIWTKKRWRDGKVINCDLYQRLWPLLKTTNLKLEYHNPQHGEPQRLAEITELARQAADGTL